MLFSWRIIEFGSIKYVLKGYKFLLDVKGGGGWFFMHVKGGLYFFWVTDKMFLIKWSICNDHIIAPAIYIVQLIVAKETQLLFLFFLYHSYKWLLPKHTTEPCVDGFVSLYHMEFPSIDTFTRTWLILGKQSPASKTSFTLVLHKNKIATRVDKDSGHYFSIYHHLHTKKSCQGIMWLVCGTSSPSREVMRKNHQRREFLPATFRY